VTADLRAQLVAVIVAVGALVVAVIAWLRPVDPAKTAGRKLWPVVVASLSMCAIAIVAAMWFIVSPSVSARGPVASGAPAPTPRRSEVDPDAASPATSATSQPLPSTPTARVSSNAPDTTLPSRSSGGAPSVAAPAGSDVVQTEVASGPPVAGVAVPQHDATSFTTTWINPGDPDIGGWFITTTPVQAGQKIGCGAPYPTPDISSHTEPTTTWVAQCRPAPGETWIVCVQPFKKDLVDGEYQGIAGRQGCTSAFVW